MRPRRTAGDQVVLLSNPPSSRRKPLSDSRMLGAPKPRKFPFSPHVVRGEGGQRPDEGLPQCDGPAFRLAEIPPLIQRSRLGEAEASLRRSQVAPPSPRRKRQGEGGMGDRPVRDLCAYDSGESRGLLRSFLRWTASGKESRVPAFAAKTGIREFSFRSNHRERGNLMFDLVVSAL